MIAAETQKQIIIKVEELFKVNIIDLQISKRGLDGEVLLAADAKGNEFAIKFGVNAINDVIAFNLIKESKLDLPVPKMLGYFSFYNKTVVIMGEINFPLLESISTEDRAKYIGSMIANLNKIHLIKSNIAGHINNQNNKMSWKEFLLFKYSGKDPQFNWDEISYRDGVDAKLIKESIRAIIKKIENQVFLDTTYSLLHTDFSQRNLFVNPKSNEIAGIVDWGDAVFGDPLYDFARVRMFIWHSNLKNDALEVYYKLLGLTNEEKNLEELYLLSQIIDYIAWFSAVKNDFIVSKLNLHQDFLRAYNRRRGGKK